MIWDIVVLYCCFKETVVQVTVHYCTWPLWHFSNLVLFMPQLERAAHGDSRIRSHLQHSNGVHKPTTPARFDTVLVEVDPELQRRSGLHSKTNPLLPNMFTHRDYRTLCRRGVSHLPASFAHWSLSSTPGIHPLVQTTPGIWRECEDVSVQLFN